MCHNQKKRYATGWTNIDWKLNNKIQKYYCPDIVARVFETLYWQKIDIQETFINN